VSDAQPICAQPKCAHVRYQHENSDLSIGKCRYPGCRCRLFRPGLHQQDRDELAALGVQPLPTDHWIYQQGTVFIIRGADPTVPADDVNRSAPVERQMY
jgi:hypothetical protein